MTSNISQKGKFTVASSTILFVILSITLKSCIIIPNFDTEWTYPEIKGYTMDSLTNTPISNVKVFDAYLGDTVMTDTTGFFNLKAKKEYIKFQWIVMDPPKPFIDLRFEKSGYQTKDLTFRYVKIIYTRKQCDTIDLKNIKLINNAP
jgi:hypothetical protein